VGKVLIAIAVVALFNVSTGFAAYPDRPVRSSCPRAPGVRRTKKDRAKWADVIKRAGVKPEAETR